MLEILGINTSLLTPITFIAKYDKIILPDECWFKSSDGMFYFTHEYIDTVDEVRDFAAAHAVPVRAKKIYYSYFKCSRERAAGEDKLEKYFTTKGYDIVYPEELSLDEQLNLLINCESFASTIGSCSHNMAFCRDNTEVILIPRANYLTPYQPTLNCVHKQNVSYVDSSFSIFVGTRGWFGPFLYYISSNLRKYFHDEETECIVNASDFWKYLRLAFGRSLNRNFGCIAQADSPDAYRYYSTAASEYFGKLVRMSWPYRIRQFLKRLLCRK